MDCGLSMTVTIEIQYAFSAYNAAQFLASAAHPDQHE